jgi:DNA polymerase III subunit epsilon
LLANEHESAAHEEVLKQLDKASDGKTLWRMFPAQPMA